MSKTLDEIARERGLKAAEAPATNLSREESARLASLHPEDKGDEQWFRNHPVTGTVAPVTDKNPTETERLSAEIEQRSGGQTRVERTARGQLVIAEHDEDGHDVRTVLRPSHAVVTEGS